MADKTVTLKGASAKLTGGVVKVEVHGPLPESHPFYGWVGRVASEWSHLEHVLDGIIWSLAEVNQVRGACITSQIMGVGPRCKAIISLGRLYHGHERIFSDDLAKGFRTLMGDSYLIADMRARIVHDPWFIETIKDTASQFKAMPYSDPRYGFVDLTEEEILAALEKIRTLKLAATELGSRVRQRLEALRETPS